MSTRNDSAATPDKDGAAVTMTDVSEGALAPVVKVADGSSGRRRRVGTLMWKAGEARGWRSTFLSI
jgi:hypothetical protein